MEVIIFEEIYQFYYLKESDPFVIIVYILWHIGVFLVVIIFSCVDRYNVHIKIKLVLGVVVASIFCMLSIYYTFNIPGYDEFVIYITPSIQFSLLSSIGSGHRVLSIFFWRQTILLILKKGKKCTNIKHAPYLKWVDINNISDDIQKHKKDTDCKQDHLENKHPKFYMEKSQHDVKSIKDDQNDISEPVEPSTKSVSLEEDVNTLNEDEHKLYSVMIDELCGDESKDEKILETFRIERDSIK